jgi:hypothetical protein
MLNGGGTFLKTRFNNRIGHAGIISACPIFVSIIPLNLLALIVASAKRSPCRMNGRKRFHQLMNKTLRRNNDPSKN